MQHRWRNLQRRSVAIDSGEVLLLPRCGHQFGQPTLEGYAKLKSYVDNGKLLGSIKHSPGFSPMPKGQAKLVDCDIEKIEAWVAAGAPQ